MIHHDAEEMQQQHHQERGGVRDDPLSCAVKVTATANAADLTEQGMPGILTANGTVVRVGNAAPQQAASSVQSAIVSATCS